MPYFSGAKQSSPGLHWKLHVFFISFQVRPMASDKKTRNWRAHRHHLWKMSAKWCDLNPCGIQTVSGKKKKIKFSSIVFNSLSQESDLAASYSLYTFPVPAARNTSLRGNRHFFPIALTHTPGPCTSHLLNHLQVCLLLSAFLLLHPLP